ncbi:hypothetical protein BCR33DRAFT_742165 [Rhizoclosmatium globosum]|uniref:Uncharacterized protein n=1 Tax=Rhizoclosmatium globosum TaxID=329046 RepID=A0A1Y2BSC4_9FUNG|nr:hypothetical protein BCR33DRAFT_742165 [Rhizoclosmatium globosum]|eukprot:ORY37643.1 hypothetical protein BCR33DRAFT_742165 [Rhizoclosmatium globosum]
MATLDQDSKTLLATSSDCSPTPESPVTPISAAHLNSISVLHSTMDASVDPEPALVILSCPNTKNKLTSIDSPDDIGPTLSASLEAPPVCHSPDTVRPIIPTSSSFTSDKLLISAVAPIFPTTYPFPIHPFLEDGITPNTDGYRPYPEIFRKYPTKKISPTINISNRVRKFLSVKTCLQCISHRELLELSGCRELLLCQRDWLMGWWNMCPK